MYKRGGLEFTVEQWKEITDARTRLKSYKDKIEIYPPYPYPESDLIPTPEPQWTVRQWDYVQQLKAQILHLDNKVTELLKRKPKKRFSKYV